MKFLLTVCLFIFSLFCYAQSDTLIVSCKKYYEQKTLAEIEEYKQLRKYKFLRFLPSFGYSIERADFIISLNSSSLISFLENKQIRHNKVSSIVLKNSILLQEDLRNILFTENKIKEVEKQLKTAQKVLKIDQKIYKIKENQYNNAELEPLAFLQAQKHIIEQEQRLQNIEYQLFELKQTLLNIAKWNF